MLSSLDRKSRRFRATVVGLALVPALASARTPRVEDPTAQVARAVAHYRSDGEASSLQSSLEALGAEAMPMLFEALVQDGVPVGASKSEWLALESDERTAVIAALSALPAREVHLFLEGVAAGDPDTPTREAALLLTGHVGTAQDVKLSIALASPAGEPIPDRSLRLAFEAALHGIVARDARVIRTISRHFTDAPRALLAPMLTAIGGGDPAEAGELLASLLARHAETDILILSELATLAVDAPRPAGASSMAEGARACLERDAPEVVMAAIRVVDRLEDRLAVPALIDLMEHSYPGVQASAREALRRITGQLYRFEAERWEAWYVDQMSWWTVEAPAEIAELRSSAPAEVSRALMDLSQRRLFRHELAEPVAACLARREPGIGLLTCAALGTLGSQVAVPALLDHIGDPDAAKQAAVRKALRRITGRYDDPATWFEAP